MRELVRRIVPFGARRAVWRARRSVPRIAQPLSLALRAGPPERPVLLLGCPRAGTTLLFEALARSPHLDSIHNEGHILWQPHHHPSDGGWSSDALGAGDVSERERRYVHLAIRMFARGGRYLDKTPESCLRIPYLNALFPGAQFVFLHRRGADNVSSLMEGWRARPRFVTHRLPERLDGLGPRSGDEWSFALIPGWRDLVHAPLEEICARQYVACNEAALEAGEGLGPRRWHRLSYEQLIARPAETLAAVCEAVGVPFDPAIGAYASELSERPSFTALSAPREGKWRELNPEVEAVQGMLDPIERRLGY
jgi:hypothetical protein